MLYHVKPRGEHWRFVESAEDPFLVEDRRRFEYISIGYETREELFWREGLTECSNCHERIWPRFSCEAELKAAQICHVCLLKRKSLRRAA